MAEYFRDIIGMDVFLFVDNVYRYTQAGAELSVTQGRTPGPMGYQPTLRTELAALQERIVSSRNGSITSLQAIYVPGDDPSDPAVSAIRQHLDATIVLSRELASQGRYPAVDPVASSSNIMSVENISARHYDLAQLTLSRLKSYKKILDIIAVIGSEELSETDRSLLLRAQKFELFMTQPLNVATAYTGRSGAYVALDATLRGVESIFKGETDEAPDGDLYMVGELPPKYLCS
jgi:F-type H+-transporting ATPase subunit beta